MSFFFGRTGQRYVQQRFGRFAQQKLGEFVEGAVQGGIEEAVLGDVDNRDVQDTRQHISTYQAHQNGFKHGMGTLGSMFGGYGVQMYKQNMPNMQDPASMDKSGPSITKDI